MNKLIYLCAGLMLLATSGLFGQQNSTMYADFLSQKVNSSAMRLQALELQLNTLRYQQDSIQRQITKEIQRYADLRGEEIELLGKEKRMWAWLQRPENQEIEQAFSTVLIACKEQGAPTFEQLDQLGQKMRYTNPLTTMIIDYLTPRKTGQTMANIAAQMQQKNPTKQLTAAPLFAQLTGDQKVAGKFFKLFKKK